MFGFAFHIAGVSASSEVDEKGRMGEPMAWSEQGFLPTNLAK